MTLASRDKTVGTPSQTLHDTGVDGQYGRYTEPKAGLKAYFSPRMNTSGIPHERQNIKQTEPETVLIFYIRVKGAVRTVDTIELLNC